MTGNIAFEVNSATEFDGRDFDLICFRDCLHDLTAQQAPLNASGYVRESG